MKKFKPSLLIALCMILLVACGNNTVNKSNNAPADNIDAGSSNAVVENQAEEKECTFIIDCLACLDEDNDSVVLPEDGYFFNEKIKFSGTESVADILYRITEENDIEIDAETSMGYLYVKSMGGIREKDFGEFSGWMFDINGEFPNEAANKTYVSADDVVRWYYICNW